MAVLIKNISFLAGLIVILSGCATPMIPKGIMSEVTPNLNFKEIRKNTGNYLGKTVLWGGEILKVENSKELSIIQVLQEPTDSDGKPGNREGSQGRFLAEVKEYLDPEVYKKGRQITIVGNIEGQKEQALDEGGMEYSFPLVAVEHLYLWPKPEYINQTPVYYGAPYWWGGYWGWGPSWNSRWGGGVGFEYFNGFDWDEPF